MMINLEPHTWIIGQVIIDVMIAGLLLWFIRYYYKSQKADLDFNAALLRAEAILSEMDRISKGLEHNLEEKKRLSRRILNQLDEGLQGAEECRRQLENTVQQYITRIDHTPAVAKDAGQARTSVKALLEKGLTKEEIARHLEISIGEIELLLKLQRSDRGDLIHRQPDKGNWLKSLPKEEATKL
jgi:transcription initiation factor IIE alpha subunit